MAKFDVAPNRNIRISYTWVAYASRLTIIIGVPDIAIDRGTIDPSFLVSSALTNRAISYRAHMWSNAVARAQGILKHQNKHRREPYLYGSGALVRSSDWNV